jgi:hypothetical protein
VAPSRASTPFGEGAESTDKSPSRSETRCGASRKARDGAPEDGKEDSA